MHQQGPCRAAQGREDWPGPCPQHLPRERRRKGEGSEMGRTRRVQCVGPKEDMLGKGSDCSSGEHWPELQPQG